MSWNCCLSCEQAFTLYKENREARDRQEIADAQQQFSAPSSGVIFAVVEPTQTNSVMPVSTDNSEIVAVAPVYEIQKPQPVNELVTHIENPAIAA